MKSTRRNFKLNDQTRGMIINKIENLGEPIAKVARDLHARAYIPIMFNVSFE